MSKYFKPPASVTQDWTRRPLRPGVKALLEHLDDGLPKKNTDGAVSDWGRSERDFVEILARMFDAEVVV